MYERAFIYNEREYLQAAKQIKDSASRAKKQTCLAKEGPISTNKC